MTLAELGFLVALWDEQHFGRAAAACNVSQPALSSALRKLETELDVVLFERSRSGVRATAIGEEVVEQARKVLASSARIRDLAKSDRDHLGEPLLVGAAATIAPYLLPQVVRHLEQAGSPLILHTEDGFTTALTEKLRQGQVDALLIATPPSDAEILTQPLYEEPFAVMMPRTHVLAAQAHLTEADVCGFPVLLPGAEHHLRQQILAALPRLEKKAVDKGVHKTGADTLAMLRSLVSNGRGLAVLPVSATAALCAGQDNLVVRPLTGVAAGRTVALAWRVSFPRHKAIDALRQAVLACSPTANHYVTTPEPELHGLLVENHFW